MTSPNAAAIASPTQLDICLKAMTMTYEANIRCIYKSMDEMTRRHATNMAELKVKLELKLSDLRDSLDYTHAEITDLKSELSRSKSEPQIPSTDCAGTCGTTATVDRWLEDLEVKVDYLENQSRCSNLHLDGISEALHETWKRTEAKVVDDIVNTLKLPSPSIEQAHRTGKHAAWKYRTIVAKFYYYNEKETVLSSACLHWDQSSPVVVYQDFSLRGQKQRPLLLPQL